MIGGIFTLVILGKHKSMVSAYRGLEAIHWDRMDWTPPKMVLSDFHKPGKVCQELECIEAGFYLELPIKRILSAMLDAMITEGYMRVVDEAPLRVEILRKPDLEQLNEYEKLFYASLADDGEFSLGRIGSVYEFCGQEYPD